jgi:hypothetical protein
LELGLNHACPRRRWNSCILRLESVIEHKLGARKDLRWQKNRIPAALLNAPDPYRTIFPIVRAGFARNGQWVGWGRASDAFLVSTA